MPIGLTVVDRCRIWTTTPVVPQSRAAMLIAISDDRGAVVPGTVRSNGVAADRDLQGAHARRSHRCRRADRSGALRSGARRRQDAGEAGHEIMLFGDHPGLHGFSATDQGTGPGRAWSVLSPARLAAAP